MYSCYYYACYVTLFFARAAGGDVFVHFDFDSFYFIIIIIPPLGGSWTQSVYGISVSESIVL